MTISFSIFNSFPIKAYSYTYETVDGIVHYYRFIIGFVCAAHRSTSHTSGSTINNQGWSSFDDNIDRNKFEIFVKLTQAQMQVFASFICTMHYLKRWMGFRIYVKPATSSQSSVPAHFAANQWIHQELERACISKKIASV